MTTEYVEFTLKPSVPYYEGTRALDGIDYRFTFRYNRVQEIWNFDIASIGSDNVDVKSIALLPGRDLLEPYGLDEWLGNLCLEDTTGGYENPSYTGLGDTWKLRYYTKE